MNNTNSIINEIEEAAQKRKNEILNNPVQEIEKYKGVLK